ncbi:NAD(P)-dependent oxidoreductase [Synechococcus sp. ROS8604]|uniref:NAD(P)-dependent oxidoreductase n=1 Tax=Synechococcus sp. ROS8604 TaxID=1442557 RepID=UPI0016449FE3|nr:NAD(P)-dependent oxidoreductase [Synechococcus sp. ROS8604]QNI88549.1 glycerate dehydrogenase [Synechococcus sp. ROS8604]
MAGDRSQTAAGTSLPPAVFLDALSLGPVDLAPMQQWCYLQAWPSTSLDERLARLQHAEIAITNKIPLDGLLLRQLPKLRLICVAATGTDQIDHAVCAERGIRVHNAGRYSRASVVQITWALILELCCAMDQRRRDLIAGSWQRSPVFSLIEPEFDELEGQTLVVLGAGDIGRGVLAIGAAFGMECIALTSNSSSAELEAALRKADVLSLHAPLTPHTQNLINALRLSWMKPSALLVNMARGGLVNLEDLCAALRHGQLAGAALDVLPVEPPGPELERLLTTPNLLISPHMGWSSRQARRRLVHTLAGHLQAYVTAMERSGSRRPSW